MRHVLYAKAAVEFDWFEDVKTDLLGHYLNGTVKRYKKQVKTRWHQTPTLAHIKERLRQTSKTTIAASQSMKLLTAKKDSKRSWPEHYLYLVE